MYNTHIFLYLLAALDKSHGNKLSFLDVLDLTNFF